MAKLQKIEKNIQKKSIIVFLIFIAVLAFFFWFFIREQEKTINRYHLSYVRKTDATIMTLLNQARLNSYVTAKEIAVLLKKVQDGEMNKEKLLDHLEIVEKREEATGVLLSQHILLAVDMEGDVLARSEWIRGERMSLPQEGRIRDNWSPPVSFEQALANALAGKTDVRKIIYDRDFLYREGYDFWNLPGMGLTVMTPITGEDKEQKGVLISITFVNANVLVVEGLKAVTDVSFAAILPSGNIVGSIFDTDSATEIERISRSPELLVVARERAEKKGDLIRKGIAVPDADFILEEFTIEKIKLTHADAFGGATHYYRVAYWLELDPGGNFASLRGIAMEIDFHIAQKSFLIHLIGGTTIFLLIIFGLFYSLIQRKIVHPIASFTAQLKTYKEKGGEKIKIPKNYQEFQELENAFNSLMEKIEGIQAVLEIKVGARTRQIKEISEGLEKRIQERTKDLQDEVNELERFQKVIIGRELKMIELKEEIEKLKKSQKI